MVQTTQNTCRLGPYVLVLLVPLTLILLVILLGCCVALVLRFSCSFCFSFRTNGMFDSTFLSL